MIYKQIECKFCNKSFGVNYKHQHNQTKQHRRNIIKEDKKKELLNIPEVIPNKYEDIKNVINILETNIILLKKLLD